MSVSLVASSRPRPTRAPSRRLPPALREPIGRWCRTADLARTPERWLRDSVALALAFGVLGAWWAPVIGVFAAAGVLAVRGGHLYARIRSAPERYDAALPPLLDGLAAELRSGRTLVGAIATVPIAYGPLAYDVQMVRARLQLGASLDEVVRSWNAGVRRPAIRAVAAALCIAYDRGGSLAVTFEHLASTLRDRAAARLDVRVQATQARLSAMVIAGAPVAYLGLVLAVDRNAARVFFGTGSGWTCLVLGLLLDAAAWYWIRSIVSTPRSGVLHRRSRRRRARAADAAFADDLPLLADLLALALGAGATPVAAVGIASQWAPTTAVAILSGIDGQVAAGATFAQALATATTSAPPFAPIGRALLAAHHGAPVRLLLERLAADVRGDLRRQADERARRVPVQLLFPLVLLVLPAFVLLSIAPVMLAGLRAL